MTSDVFSAV